MNGLLATKLYMPGSRPGLVGRPRLLDRLDQAVACDLILVCAPAGFGKTVLLAEWARRGEVPVRLAVTGHRRQRPGAVLAARRRRAGSAVPGASRAGGPAARAAATAH